MKARVPARTLTFAAMLLAPALAVAQPPGGPPDGEGGSPPRRGQFGPPGSRMMGGPGPLMEALDTDHDGTLSAAEIERASTSLKSLDRDGDGRIGRDEMRPGPGNGPAGRGRNARRGQGGPGGFGPPPGGPGRRGGPGGTDGGGPGGPGGRFGRPGGGPDGPGGGQGPAMGHVIPPFLRDELDLSAAQQNQIQALEANVRTGLCNILTPQQIQQFEESFRRGPGGPGGGFPGGPGGPPDEDGPPRRPGRPD